MATLEKSVVAAFSAGKIALLAFEAKHHTIPTQGKIHQPLDLVVDVESSIRTGNVYLQPFPFCRAPSLNSDPSGKIGYVRRVLSR